MVKKILVGIVLVCGFVVANAYNVSSNSYPQLIAQDTWVNGGVTHYYDVFEYLPSSQYLARNWTIAENFVTNPANISGTGWTLAGITSAAEQSEITSLMQKTGKSGEYWVGGEQIPYNSTPANADWNWVTGEAWSYTDWFSGEPNDGSNGGMESYLGVRSNDGWSWNDEGNTGYIYGFIAERTASIPEPATFSLLLLGMLSLFGLNLKRKRK
jgi:hypothetical protein